MLADPTASVMSPPKEGLALTRALAADLAGRNISVNALAPGMIASPPNREFTEDEETGAAWNSETVAGRRGRMEDVAGAPQQRYRRRGRPVSDFGFWLNANIPPRDTEVWSAAVGIPRH